MSNDILNQFTDNSGKLFAPVFKLNKLAVATVEELINFELNALREFSQQSLRQLKAAVEISDLESFQAFTESQNAVLKSVSEKIVKDAKLMADIGENFRNEVLQIAREGAAELKAEAA